MSLGKPSLERGAVAKAQKPPLYKWYIWNTVHILDLPQWGKGSYFVTHSQPKWRANVRQSRIKNYSIADIHVFFVMIISTVDFSLLRRTWSAVPLYWPGRKSGVVRILPVFPLLLTVVALFFFVVVPSDLWNEMTFGFTQTNANFIFVQTVTGETHFVCLFQCADVVPTFTSFSLSDFLSLSRSLSRSRSRSLSLLFFFLLGERSRSSRLRSLSLLRSRSLSFSLFFSFLCLKEQRNPACQKLIVFFVKMKTSVLT